MKETFRKIASSLSKIRPNIRLPKFPTARKTAEVKSSQKFPTDKVFDIAKSIIFVLILLLFTAEIFFGIMIYGVKKTDNISKFVAKIIPYPAAFTTSGVVTVSEYWKQKDYIEHFYSSTKQSGLDKSDLSKQILEQEVQNKIIEKEAIAYKIKVSSADIDNAMNQIYDANGGQDEVMKSLNDLYGLNLGQFKELVQIQLLRDKISKEVIKRITVRHILIRVDQSATQDKVDEAKKRIDGYLAEIKGGLVFSDAAKKYSEDVGSNQDGGLLESFARGDMVKEFEDVAFTSKVGQISDPFRTSFGWHILEVESSSGFVNNSFDNWLNNLMKTNLVIYLYHR